jgi:antitoxin (DNA-binding transcriptional repressor) of toxin-antitoxin stability system
MTKIFDLLEAHDQPMAKLMPALSPKREPRMPSNALGVTYMADDFDAPLPPELLKQFGYDP